MSEGQTACLISVEEEINNSLPFTAENASKVVFVRDPKLNGMELFQCMKDNHEDIVFSMPRTIDMVGDLILSPCTVPLGR